MAGSQTPRRGLGIDSVAQDVTTSVDCGSGAGGEAPADQKPHRKTHRYGPLGHARNMACLFGRRNGGPSSNFPGEIVEPGPLTFPNGEGLTTTRERHFASPAPPHVRGTIMRHCPALMVAQDPGF